MGFRSEIDHEQQMKRLADYLDSEIEMAKYENKATSELEAIRESTGVPRGKPGFCND